PGILVGERVVLEAPVRPAALERAGVDEDAHRDGHLLARDQVVEYRGGEILVAATVLEHHHSRRGGRVTTRLRGDVNPPVARGALKTLAGELRQLGELAPGHIGPFEAVSGYGVDLKLSRAGTLARVRDGVRELLTADLECPAHREPFGELDRGRI